MDTLLYLPVVRKDRSAPSGTQLDAVVASIPAAGKWLANRNGIATLPAVKLQRMAQEQSSRGANTPPRAPYDLLSSGNTAVGGVPRNVRPELPVIPQN